MYLVTGEAKFETWGACIEVKTGTESSVLDLRPVCIDQYILCDYKLVLNYMI
jgi:hypothetical protein